MAKQHLIFTTRWTLLLTFSALTGCSTFTSPKEQPVIEDKVGDAYSTLAVTAERRVIIFGRKKPEIGSTDDEPMTGKRVPGGPVVCAEPSPDVAESLVTSLKVIAEASAKKGPEEAKASAEFSRNLATAISNLFSRSQGIQFFRDSSYALCQAHINGLIAANDYLNTLKDLSQKAYELIEKEIPNAELKKVEAAAQREQDAQSKAAQSALAAKNEAANASASAEKAGLARDEALKAASKTK